jgi:hypothetical protein
MSKTAVRNLGIGVLALVATLALACSGEGLDMARNAGVHGDDGFVVGTQLEAPQRDASVTMVDKAAADAASIRSEAGAAGGGTAAGPAGAPSTQQTALDRKIVQTASLRLQVKEVGAGFEEVGRIAASAGGFVASSSFSYKGEQEIASVTMRVPTGSYQTVLSQLRGLAEKVDGQDSNASDVTEEYTDLQSRLRNLEATEAQLLQLLARAQTITDILTVQDRLNAVRGEIEVIKGRVQMLDNLTELATITVHLRPAVGGASTGGAGVDLGGTISEAWEDSLRFLGSIAEGVLTVIVFGWWVPVLGMPAALIAWALARNRPRPTSVLD